MIKWKRDMILSIFLIALSAGLFIYAGTFTTDVINIPAAMPDVYMRLWLGILFVLSVLLLIRTIRKKPTEMLPRMWGMLQLVTLGALILYLILLDVLGFRICTGLFVFGTMTLYGFSGMTEKPAAKAVLLQLGKYLLIALAVVVASDLLFRKVLSCNLPRFDLF